MALPSIILPAHATNIYEMGYKLQYCPFTQCRDRTYFWGASGTLYAGGSVPVSTDSYGWDLSLDNFDNNVHTWFQAGVIIGIDPNGIFHSSPVFYVETTTSTNYTFQAFGTVTPFANHNIKICTWDGTGICSNVSGLSAWLDGSLIYNAKSPFPSGQQFIPAAALEVHQAGNNYGISVNGSWSNLFWWGGGNGVDPSWCGRSWGSLFCNDLVSTNSKTWTVPTLPTPYYITSVSQTNFYAGLDPSSGGGGSSGDHCSPGPCPISPGS